jgi:uncharacterized protein (DUF427 family)
MEQNVQVQAKSIKIPGPDHPISIERDTERVIVSVAGRVIADTREALTLHEAHYPAVHYIPRKNVDMTLLARTDRTTYCPYKGDAAYFSIPYVTLMAAAEPRASSARQGSTGACRARSGSPAPTRSMRAASRFGKE